MPAQAQPSAAQSTSIAGLRQILGHSGLPQQSEDALSFLIHEKMAGPSCLIRLGLFGP